MMKFTVNLARRPSENVRRAWVIWGGMLAVLSAILVVLATGTLISAWNNRRIHRQQSEVELRMAPLRRRQLNLDRQLQDPAVRAALSRSQFLNGLIDRKSVSWTHLFERLEKLMPDDLQLVSIRPQQQSGEPAIVLVVASESLDPAIAFVSRLEQAPDFSSAHVVREGRRDATAEQPTQVRVEIETLYQPPAASASVAAAVAGNDQAPQKAPAAAAAPRPAAPARQPRRAQ